MTEPILNISSVKPVVVLCVLIWFSGFSGSVCAQQSGQDAFEQSVEEFFEKIKQNMRSFGYPLSDTIFQLRDTLIWDIDPSRFFFNPTPDDGTMQDWMEPLRRWMLGKEWEIIPDSLYKDLVPAIPESDTPKKRKRKTYTL